MPADNFGIHPLRPDDYQSVSAVVDEWWQRPMRWQLPPVFFEQFAESSFIAHCGTDLAGFLIGFMSPHRPDEAYVHMAGVAPRYRGAGLGRTLYERFFALAEFHGRSTVRAPTSARNRASRSFHARLGFREEPTAIAEATAIDGLEATEAVSRVGLAKPLTAQFQDDG